MSNSANKTTNGMENLGPAHFVLVPFVSQGHMIPMTDIARILAERGARVSYITTPENAARIKTIIDDVKRSALPIDFVEFPAKEVGLPEGSSGVKHGQAAKEQFMAMLEGSSKLQSPLENYLLAQQQQGAGPTCMITAMYNYWTMPVAQKLRIPRLIFHGPSCFYILISYLLKEHKVYDRVTDVFEPFVVPGLPHKFEVNMVQEPGFIYQGGWRRKYKDGIWNAEASADGMVINSFDDLEGDYVECLKAKWKNVWTIGPVCLHSEDSSAKAARGNKASIAIEQVFGWLEKRKRSSVLYVSFGSIRVNAPAQLMEIGSALEMCNVPFIWVINDKERTPEVEKWLSDGFEERVSNRGLLIKGWAPQAAILPHPAIGGLVTHGGWNSILEALSEGLPMVTWPKIADQFMNVRLVVDVLKIGVPIGVPFTRNRIESSQEEVVRRKDIEAALMQLMDEGEEGESRRNRAREFGHKGKKAMEEGGS